MGSQSAEVRWTLEPRCEAAKSGNCIQERNTFAELQRDDGEVADEEGAEIGGQSLKCILHNW